MYEDIELPVRSRCRLSSGSRTRIYFIRNSAGQSLFFLKWVELVLSVLCLCSAVVTVSAGPIRETITIIILFFINSFTILVVLAEITYSHFKSYLSVILQILIIGINCVLNSTITILLYNVNSSNVLFGILIYLNGITSVLFLVDLICKIVISIFLYQITGVKIVKDVGVSAFIPFPSPQKTKIPRSILTATPITYGGTFPVGKNQPPFLAEDRNPPIDFATPDKGFRQKTINTTAFIENKDKSPKYDFDKDARSKFIQARIDQQDKATTTFALLHMEEERRKKSPWTCSTPSTSRKFEARKLASMSTPITYSGTFAVNKELVPITPETIMNSPQTSPRIKESILKRAKEGAGSKSEGNSPRTLGYISEEKYSEYTSSSDNCSLKRSSYVFIKNAETIPGTVMDEMDSYQYKRMQYEQN
ncbi:uncharacterized protein LOC115879420 [Sitophilus oryzae]|uniref:Uncharacterized protein LOC115879420 n=1 Tax=Sitophilus oryzae TaxID=7048 RepID=A0A6J2XLC1_SITOR|nr:uncharacterized protein LOC115879420 [Sitophilus oryzae]